MYPLSHMPTAVVGPGRDSAHIRFPPAKDMDLQGLRPVRMALEGSRWWLHEEYRYQKADQESLASTLHQMTCSTMSGALPYRNVA